MRYSDDTLYDKNGYFLVSKWIKPIMVEHAKLVTLNGGDILELGFGLGICSEEIQKYNIKSHTIVENDPFIYERLLEFVEKNPNVKPVFGSWLEFESEIKFDGIFYDTETLTWELPKHTPRWSKNGTIISWFSPATKETSILRDYADSFIEIPINMPEYKIYDLDDRDTYYMPMKIFIQ